MSVNLILVIIAALAVWAGSLYVRPFGRCYRCRGTGHIKRGPRRRPVCPRCKGRRRAQRFGSRTVHRLIRAVHHGQAAAARHRQQEED